METPNVTPELVAEAYEWLGDVCDDLPVEVSAAEIVRNVNRWYEGGWAQFVRDSEPGTGMVATAEERRNTAVSEAARRLTSEQD